MKRILACLAALALSVSAATAVCAQTLPSGYDPIGDALAAVAQTAAARAADVILKASLYHGGHHMAARDSLGCRVVPMRTVAVDPSVVARHSIIFIKETVGLPLPGGGVHNGYWYASDVGGAIKGARIDLFTGENAASMRVLMPLNLKTLTVTKVGDFNGCPPTAPVNEADIKAASNATADVKLASNAQ